ncbi:methyltransferase family protein [Leisingera sp. S232]|uniref:methyltransferase family protein n=1 Tax=Leisingera sp. S232 TaxID=3415132 RepID=UPI003C79C919
MTRWLDVPPVWLAVFVVAAWLQAEHFAFGLSFGGAWAGFLAGILLGGGILLALLAITEMRRQKTTVIPHRTPSRLVQSGIFSRSRNPIYLGDVLILAGLILWFDAVLSLPLISVFLWLLEKRFVVTEEDRMRREFRADWARYEKKVRRWI